MLCPNCDNVINAIGCQGCGWHVGDQFPAHRLEPGSSHPLKEGVGIYPPRVGEPRTVQIVKDDPGVQPELKLDQMILPVDAADPVEVLKEESAEEVQNPDGSEIVRVPLPAEKPDAPEAPIPDPVSKSVQ